MKEAQGDGVGSGMARNEIGVKLPAPTQRLVASTQWWSTTGVPCESYIAELVHPRGVLEVCKLLGCMGVPRPVQL